MSERMKQQCDCGCGGADYHNRLATVEAEEAIDGNIRQTRTAKRFWVLRECREPFERELGLMIMLEKLVRAWAPKPKTFLQRLNVPRTFYWWCRRVAVARQVMRIQHAIHERTRGFEYAKVRALSSALLFGAPRFMQGLLAWLFIRRLRRVS